MAMNEYLDRAELIIGLQKDYESICGRKPDFYMGYQIACGFVDNFQIADVAPVVRCKDCKFSNIPRSRKEYYKEKGILRCDKRGGIAFSRCVYSTDSCSYGERSTDNAEK